MNNKSLEVKKRQATTLMHQFEMILMHTSLPKSEIHKVSKDLSDVVLTSWDITEANLDPNNSDATYGDTWFTQLDE